MLHLKVCALIWRLDDIGPKAKASPRDRGINRHRLGNESSMNQWLC
jgi:hypothetical protein